MNIIHITAHMGGGAGKAISSHMIYSLKNSNKYKYTLVILEEPKNTRYVDICKENGVDIIICPTKNNLENLLKKADAVILNWWNHPLTTKLFMDFLKIPIRLIFWLHVNGCTYPSIPFEFANTADGIFFTTEFSYENKLWSKEERDIIREKSEILYGMGDIELDKVDYKENYKKNSPFKIVYVGTTHYSKINKDFVKYAYAVKQKIEDVCFVIVGEEDDILQKDFEDIGLCKNVEWTGYIQNVEEVLKESDVFGYILNPYHFGTTENVILEAFSVGVPVVTLNENTEKYIIQDGKNGFTVKDPEEYAEKISLLYNDENLRKVIGTNGRLTIEERYNYSNNFKRYEILIDKVLKEEKTIKFENINKTPFEWFLEFCNKEKSVFKDSLHNCLSEETIEGIKNLDLIFRDSNKSSPYHYSRFFKQDKNINEITKILDNI